MESRRPPTQLRQPPYLPENVIMLILLWLPLKTLMQFKCVCRSWNSLISSPVFVKLKYLRSPKGANIMLTIEYLHDPQHHIIRAVPCSVPSLLNSRLSAASVYSSFPIMDDYWVVGTCHGLVCLAGPIWDSEDSTDEFWVKIWNPVTRIASGRSPILPCNSFVSLELGFGYDYKNEAYKVVALITSLEAEKDSEKCQVKVYTMGDSGWRDKGSFPALPIAGRIRNKNDGIYITGTLNWLALRNFEGDNAWEDVTALDQVEIVSLDLGEETYKHFALPDGLDERPILTPVLGVLNEYLYLCHDYDTTNFVLWQMKEFGNARSWTLLLNVTNEHLQLDSFFLVSEVFPLVPMCMSENGDVVLILSAEDIAVIQYDFKDDRVERHAIPRGEVWIQPKDYTESLVLPL
ncbi:F-box/kelch-repeat protein At3g23880-like [Arachis hypogaea]|uniref:F-box/kelch-repeat protein At3g23880-like n=1 Tax=Arachis hypogaea TaxID=3818 RepID=UPI000DECBE01|nr:F-box/kelch-repeat protein At3g23880-like [Arachis hypogaea]XP_025675990.1 F-box/kelch-repeat protein At3g23880-like [Arachis hypogaea]XP_029144638.1 F-box/kelch-repeat protein At3g23880-like [Arachis hypogaea]XP_029144639.1 F-box/kelch-repeat protein At3g23880-like [Arachis hypogaea]XP_029151440.1 F-box/kelch-repeat protein At3g23880-like [Arachis hypogaea]XP_029151441.1 F-box/kelch-repeat protein At3g23880-like [Arachis hypogaea]